MARRPGVNVKRLDRGAHAVYRLAPDLLLVFKPRGHSEPTHAHGHRKQLRILRGRLRVSTARGEVTLTPASRAYSLAPGRTHSTRALADTWLIALTPRLKKGGKRGFSKLTLGTPHMHVDQQIASARLDQSGEQPLQRGEATK